MLSGPFSLQEQLERTNALCDQLTRQHYELCEVPLLKIAATSFILTEIAAAASFIRMMHFFSY